MKKIKFNSFFILLSLSTIMFFSCSDDDDDNGGGSSSEIVGRWELTQEKWWTTIDGEVVEGSEHTGPNRGIDFFIFNEDGTGTEGEGTNENDIEDWPITWKVKGDVLTVGYDNGDEDDNFKITELTSTKLVYLYEEDEDDGTVWHSESTYKRVK